MIDERSFPTVRRYWPIFTEAAAKYRLDAKLLLALGWVQSGLNPSARSAAGAVGVMQMMPETAAEVAGRIGRKMYDLTDVATSVQFAAAHLSSLIARFGLPRLGVAAYVGGSGAVRDAGGQVPEDIDVQRTVRNVMAVWHWLMVNMTQVLESELPSNGNDGSASKTASSASSMVLPEVPTSTTSSGGSALVTPPAWRLIAPPEDWKHPLPIDAAQVAVLEQLAVRLKLAFTRDDEQRKVYVGLRGQVKPAASKAGLIMPVPGADARHNGAYAADSGLDIMVPVGSPVVAAGAGTIVYSEPGHTPWTTPPDTPNSILIALDTPFVYRGRKYGYTWYTHLSRLRYHVPDGSGAGRHVEQGELIGWTGVGNRVPHLHFGVVVDRAQSVFVHPFELAIYFGWMGR
jgi:murein DD-endopeptidase MepM/ murein hydrolase activator NlpD